MNHFVSIYLDEFDVAELLVENGGNTTYVLPNGRKALDYAVIHSNFFQHHIFEYNHKWCVCNFVD